MDAGIVERIDGVGVIELNKDGYYRVRRFGRGGAQGAGMSTRRSRLEAARSWLLKGSQAAPVVPLPGSWHNTDYKKREGTSRKASGSVRIPWEDTFKQWMLLTGLELPERVEVKVIEKTNRRSWLGAVGEQVADGVEGYPGTFVSNVSVPDNWMELADIVFRSDWKQYVTFRVVPVDIEDIRILFQTGVLPEHHGVESLLHHDEVAA